MNESIATGDYISYKTRYLLEGVQSKLNLWVTIVNKKYEHFLIMKTKVI